MQYTITHGRMCFFSDHAILILSIYLSISPSVKKLISHSVNNLRTCTCSKNFGPTYARQPEHVIEFCEDFLKVRGIDRVLARYIRMESSRKNTREKLIAMRGLVNFLGDGEWRNWSGDYVLSASSLFWWNSFSQKIIKRFYLPGAVALLFKIDEFAERNKVLMERLLQI